MSEVTKDRQALDWVLQNRTDNRAPDIMNILGIDNNDLNALEKANELEKANPDDTRITQVRNIVFDKIARKRPVDKTSSGLNLGDRLVVKNLIDEDPNLQKEYLERKGFETRWYDNKLEFRKPGDINFKPIDPEGFDKWDVFDIMNDVVEGLVTGVAATSKTAGAVLTPVTGGSSIAAGAVAGGAASGLYETGRQYLGKLLGARDEVDTSRIGISALSGALIPTLTGVTAKTGRGIAGIENKLIQKIQKGKIKPNAEEIKEAAKIIGAKPTPGQIYDQETIRLLESAQLQSAGQLGGIKLRQQVVQNIEATKKAAEAIVQDAAQQSSFDIGDKASKELIQELSNKIAPAEEIYGSLETLFRRSAFKPNLTGIKNEIKALEKGTLKFDHKSRAILNQIKEDLKYTENLDDLKALRSALGNEYSRNPTDKGLARITAQLYPKMTEARSQTLLDLAEERGGTFFIEAKMAIEEADRIYKQAVSDVISVVKRPGAKLKTSPKIALNDFIEKTPEIARIDKILKTNDPAKIAAVKEAFPSAFETLRTGKIADIVKRSTTKDGLSPRSLVDRIDSMPPETATLIFGEDAMVKAKALKTFLDSVPGKKLLGPSGTPEGITFLRFKFITDNLQSLKRSLTLSMRTRAIDDKSYIKEITKFLNTLPAISTGQIITQQKLKDDNVNSLIPNDNNILIPRVK